MTSNVHEVTDLLFSNADRPAVDVGPIDQLGTPLFTARQMVADAEAQKKMKALFLKMAGSDMEVDAYELQTMLNSVFTKEGIQ